MSVRQQIYHMSDKKRTVHHKITDFVLIFEMEFTFKPTE